MKGLALSFVILSIVSLLFLERRQELLYIVELFESLSGVAETDTCGSSFILKIGSSCFSFALNLAGVLLIPICFSL